MKRRLVLATGLLFAICTSAISKDLAVLTRVLYSVDFIEQGIGICSVPSVQLSEQEHDLFASARTLSAEFKVIITAGLPQDEETVVLRGAADRARSELRDVLSVIKSYPPDQEYVELARWCHTKMTAFVKMIVDGFGRERTEIESLIAKAKRD